MAEQVRETQVVTPEARGYYVAFLEPKPNLQGDLKFSACVAVPKEDKAGIKLLQDAVTQAAMLGIDQGKWSKAQIKSVALPFRDGDAEVESGKKKPGSGFEGMMFFNANSNRMPGVVKKTAAGLVEVMNEDEVYSGAWYKFDVNFYPSTTGGVKRVCAGLNNVMKIRDDQRLDGARSASEAFADYGEVVEERPGQTGDEKSSEDEPGLF